MSLVEKKSQSDVGVIDLSKQQPIDLEVARKTKTFDSNQVTLQLFSNQKNLDRHLKFQSIIDNELIFEKTKRVHMSRTERFLNALKICKRAIELKYQLGIKDEDFFEFFHYIDEAVPMFIQQGMFLSAIRDHTSKNQYDLWFEDAKNFKMLGCYAQTEIGHGSSLTNLETTATFDQETDEFVINSPTLSSAKFWPGALAKWANHAVVYAQLIINGQHFGPHGFLVPIRSIGDHTLVKGVVLKDIGAKAGYEGTDNGYATFDKVRVPRFNMLMRFSQVDRQGQYKKPKHNKINFAVMTETRVGITYHSFKALARAVTIAIRYATVRRQGTVSGKLEPQVITYPLVQYRLFPLLANTFAINFVSRWLAGKFQTMMTSIKEHNDFSLLPEVHGISAALKGYCSGTASDGIEEARRCLGGQGYLKASGIPEYYNSFKPTMTYEGENGLLTQQPSRFLLKEFVKAIQSDTTNLYESTYFLSLFATGKAYVWDPKVTDKANKLEAFVTLFSYRVFDLTKRLYEASQTSHWDALGIHSNNVSRAFAQYITLRHFVNGILQLNQSGKATHGTLNVLTDLAQLYAVSVVDKEPGDFLQNRSLLPEQLDQIRNTQQALFQKLLPEVVGLVDCFQFSDGFLASDLGVSKGDVYRRIVDSLDKNPLNLIDPVNQKVGYEEYIRPIVKDQCKNIPVKSSPTIKVTSKL